MSRFVPLGKQGVGRVKDHGGRLARILDDIERERAGGYTTRERMNDYVGPPVYAAVTWAQSCPDSERHSLGLMSHTCLRCGAVPEITWEKP